MRPSSGVRALLMVIAVAAAAVRPPAVAAVQLPSGFRDGFVAGGLYSPIGIAFLPDGRLIVAEQQGRLRLVVEGKLGAVDPLVAVDSVQSAPPHHGLTGVAVDPRWPAHPYVYICYDALDSTVHVSRYLATGELSEPTGVFLALEPASRYDVMRATGAAGTTPGSGAMRFAPDGMLYVSLGDGGTPCAAQDTSSLRGAILRIDVRGLPSGSGGPPDPALLAPPDNPFADHPVAASRLVWALGFRNPFRFHVDPENGVLFAADVGASSAEEIDLVDQGGLDFGWPYFEGTIPHLVTCMADPAPSYREPLLSYSERTPAGQAAVIGAGIHRGLNFPRAYQGDYFFADYFSGFLRRLEQVDGQWQIASPVAGQPSPTDWGRGFEGVSDYLMGPDGSLWYCRNGDADGSGEIRRVFYDPGSVVSVSTPSAEGVDLLPPYPSPASSDAHFPYVLSRPARVSLDLYDAAGRRVRRLVAPVVQPGGRYVPVWDGSLENGCTAPSGVYLARLRVEGETHERRIALLR